MGILDRLLGKKDKKDTTDVVSKTDEPVVKTEYSRQDVRDAMIGKNGKMILMQGVAIDTITMREIIVPGTPARLTTVRGIATSIKYFISSRNVIMPAEYRSANVIYLNIGEKRVNINKDNSLPVINEGDDVETMCIPAYSKDVVDALAVKNHTSGVLWCFNIRRAALGF